MEEIFVNMTNKQLLLLKRVLNEFKSSMTFDEYEILNSMKKEVDGKVDENELAE